MMKLLIIYYLILLKEEKNIKELQEKISQLENIIFSLDLIDHWTRKDTELFEKYNKELTQLKELVINELTR